MTGKCIADGDYVLVTPAQSPKHGEIVVARFGAEATVKTYTQRGSAVVLEPAHPNERAIEVMPGDDFAILGVVCGVFRPFFEKEPEREPEELPVPQQIH